MKCPSCFSHSYQFVKANGDLLYKCSSCKLIFIYPYPTEDEMVQRHTAESYADSAYFSTGESASLKNQIPSYKFIKEQIFKYIKSGETVLDIGAGSGDFSKMISSKYNLIAIEPSNKLADVIRKKVDCKIHNGTLNNFESNQNIQAVVMLDVIEHCASPSSMVKKVNELLPSNGFVFVSTVDSESLLFITGKLIWKLSKYSKFFKYILNRIYYYQHNWFFNRRVLKSLFEDNGFKIIDQRGFEYPLARLQESPLIVLGMWLIYLVQFFLGHKTEQTLIARKK